MSSAILDSNEASHTPVLQGELLAHDEVDDVAVESLEVGDFAIRGCLFERKTPTDFARSLRDGRLEDQVNRLDAHANPGAILVEGDMVDLEDAGGLPGASLRGMVASILANTDVPVVFCSRKVWLVDVAARIARKEDSEFDGIAEPSPSSAHETDFMLNCYMGAEGVGKTTAEALAEAFPTVSALADADREAIEAVEGVGPTIADRLLAHC